MIFALVFYFFIALPLSFFSISFFLYLRFPLWKFIYLRPIYTILILIYYGVNTSQEGDKCRWRGRIDCWQWRNEWSERSVPEMKWKVAECSGMNGWTASNAGCWCGCVNEWIGMECWGTKHGMEMKEWMHRQEAQVIINTFSSLLHLCWVVGNYFVVIHFFFSFRGEHVATLKSYSRFNSQR